MSKPLALFGVLALLVAAVLALEQSEAEAQTGIVPGFVQIDSGEWHTCGLHASGVWECWGYRRSERTNAWGGAFSAVSVGGGYVEDRRGSGYTCGLRPSGAVECWGWDAPTPPGGSFSAISAGGEHTCGLRPSGAIECWGDNRSGRADALGGSFSAVSAGGGHTCGLRASGAIECWGDNDYGRADAPGGSFSAVSAGAQHTCGLRASGVVECWGANRYGQTDAPGGSFSAVSAGYWHTCGLRASGAVECWGANRYGQTDAPGGSFSAVSAGGRHTCGLRPLGAVECWGEYLNMLGTRTAWPWDTTYHYIAADWFTPVAHLAGCRYTDIGNVTSVVQRSGRWTATDCERDGRLYDVYRITVSRVSDVDWRVEESAADSSLHQEYHRLRAGGQRLTPGTYWLATSGSAANVDKELPYTLTLEVQPSDLTLNFDSPTDCAVTDLGEIRGALTRRGAWTQRDCEDGSRYSDWYTFSLPPLGLPEDAGQRPLTIDVLSSNADAIVTRAQCAFDYRADPPVDDDATLGTLGTSDRCFLTDDDSGDGVNARLSWDVRTDTTRLIYWIRVDTSDYGPATGSYTLRITAPEPAAGAPPSYGVQPESTSGRIVARRLTDGRTEFGWLPAGAEERVLPRGRYFPADAQVGRWLRSTPVVVDGVELGRINARRLADGRIEFAFTPTDGERILPSVRYFPAGAAVDRWLRSSEIESAS